MKVFDIYFLIFTKPISWIVAKAVLLKQQAFLIVFART